jgi:hypothetical protein
VLRLLGRQRLRNKQFDQARRSCKSAKQPAAPQELYGIGIVHAASTSRCGVRVARQDRGNAPNRHDDDPGDRISPTCVTIRFTRCCEAEDFANPLWKM